jgi:hypothetical protein
LFEAREDGLPKARHALHGGAIASADARPPQRALVVSTGHLDPLLVLEAARVAGARELSSDV